MASSSRRTVTSGLVALALGACRRGERRSDDDDKDRADLTGVRLAPGGPYEDEAVVARRAAWLAFASLPAETRRQLRDDLPVWIASLVARHSPVIEDLVETPDDLVKPFGPLLTAARATARRSWGADRIEVVADGGFVARDPRSPSEQKAAWLGWPAAYGVRVRKADTALDGLPLAPQSHVGLVVRASTITPRLAPVDFDLPARLAAIDPLLAVLAHLRTPPPDESLVPWLALTGDEVFVVPRLGSLAQRAEFDDETKRFASR